MLGFSVYLNDIRQDYIQKMLQCGFNTIFTSLQLPEAYHESIFKDLQTLKALVGHQAMIIADINPKIFNELKGLDREVLSCIDALRFDESVAIDDMVAWSRQAKLVLNASTDALNILNALNGKVDLSQVIVMHNYYPRPETGLDTSFFIEKNLEIKALYPDVQIMAFVSGSTFRGPVYKGLPTLEAHRGLHPLVAYHDLMRMHVDRVMIGDLSITDRLIAQFDAYVHDDTVLLGCTMDSNYAFVTDMLHRNRFDVARDVVRSENYRKLHNAHVAVFQPITRKHGAITLDNHLYGRYMNELQITKKALPQNDAVNVIGEVDAMDLPLLDLIGSGTKFKLIRSDENGFETFINRTT